MKYLFPYHLFAGLLAVVAALALWEIGAVGFDLDHSDPNLTITYFVTAHGWSAFLAAALCAAFGIGLAVHFIYEWRGRGGPA